MQNKVPAISVEQGGGGDQVGDPRCRYGLPRSKTSAVVLPNPAAANSAERFRLLGIDGAGGITELSRKSNRSGAASA